MKGKTEIQVCAIDWAHTEKKVIYYNGKKISKRLPKDTKVIIGENIPGKYCKKWLKDGIKVYRIHQNIISDYRETKGIEKTDENDAILIYEYYQLHPEDFKSYIGEALIKNLYSTFKEIQKIRVSTENRVWANSDDKTNNSVLNELERVEKHILKIIEQEIPKYPVWNGFLKHIKGINVSTACGLISYIGDISKFPNKSNLDSYFGLDVKDGKAPRLKKGKQFNKHLKGKSLILGIIGDNFIKQRTPLYREIYDNEKERLRKMYPEPIDNPNYLKTKKGFKKLYTDMHIHRMAVRKMMKIFTEHYWVIDRQLHGLSTRPPYVHDKLKHGTYIKPLYIPQELLPFNPVSEGNHLPLENQKIIVNKTKEDINDWVGGNL